MNKYFKYSGLELDFFEKAINWKSYYLKLCRNLFKHNYDVLEIGAGIGGISKVFIPSIRFSSWTLIEPDKNNFQRLTKNLNFTRNLKVNALNLSIEDYENDSHKFDLILLADVIEHIKDDKKTLNKLFKKLKPTGILIIFVPACQFLYSPFDKQIGHFRRYSIQSLEKLLPSDSKVIEKKYIDSIGFFASLVNKLFLKSPNPSIKQVLFWDRVWVPLSRFFDRLLFFKFGKNIYLAVSK